MKAFLRRIRISPKKVALVAKLVRGKPVSAALTQLQFTPKRSAPLLRKLIASAAANAENNFKQDANKLAVSKIVVTAGQTLKRGNPVSRGRWHPILKRTSHVEVELAPIIATVKDLKKTSKTAKDAEKSTEKTEAKTAENPAAKKETVKPKKTSKEDVVKAA